jgi:hypothetical protein
VNISDLIAVLDEIDRDRRELLPEYRWLHSAAYGLSAKSGGRSARGVARPTETSALARKRIVGRLHEVDEQLETARKAMNKAKALATLNYKARDLLGLHDEEFPRSIDKKGMESVREAAARRAARGEGYGEA